MSDQTAAGPAQSARPAAGGPAPHGPDGDVQPLITAAEACPVLERRAIAARESILLSFRIFDTRATLRTAEARAVADGEDWAALLVALAAKGVRIRMQVSDFDPIACAGLHQAAWASLRHLAARAAANSDAEGRIEAMAARHPAEVGAFWRRALAGRARRELEAIRRSADGPLEDSHPGLRPALAGETPRLFPATHHQKLAVIDDDFALAGGLDIDDRRWDTPDHDRPAEETWRDVSLAITGRAAETILSAAARIWNDCVNDWAAREDVPSRIPGLARPAPCPLAADDSPGGGGPRRIETVTTRSVPRRGPFAFSPRTVSDATERAAIEIISGARRFLYIETQFLRSPAIAAALSAAARTSPRLELVVILPFAPERLAFKGARGATIRHGEALQARALRRIDRAFGPRAALLSPAKPARRTPADAFVAYGAGMIYVHSKVMIADGAEALVGSANLNGRSMRWDTEVSVRWRDPAAVAAFLERLADKWIGVRAGPADRLAPWRASAEANAAVVPDLREGFLLPHDRRRAARFGRPTFWLPNELF
ncbi:phospholipase D-like domain-containing protein [Pikeienuella sp. HZG-20]|uniref:phospholipase D-like domain-containing protein n=1 Tax=Paludibacillus litoralis TaxID=3133267 RepID=UPI0030EB18CD